MKKLLLLCFMVLCSVVLFSQNTNSKDASKIKSLKLIVALKEYPKKADAEEKVMIDSANVALEYAMKNHWNFNAVEKSMPLSEAKKFVKSNKGYCYITIAEGVTTSMKHGAGDGAFRYMSYSERLGIYTPSLTAATYLPKYGNTMTKATAAFATAQLNKMLELLYNKEFSNMFGSVKYVKENGPNIIKKTLLIPKEYISPKLSKEDIKLAYPYDIDFCDIDKVERAILNKDPKYAVLYYVPVSISGKYLHRLFITSAQDGDIYGVADGNKVQLDLAIFGTVGNKKYLINDKELKQIGKIATK